MIRRLAAFTGLFVAGLGLMVVGDYLGKNPILIGAGLCLVFSGLYALFSADGGNSG